MVPVPDHPLVADDVAVRFPVKRDWHGRPTLFAHALNGVSLTVERGANLGIVGESGCGKSTLAQVLTGLVAPSSGQLIRGRPHDGTRAVDRIGIVFQDPHASLDPRMRVWRIITEPVFLRGGALKSELRALAMELAVKVGLRPEHVDRFPHEFSGGQRQRIAIARALSSSPDIVILDEPTSALDISVQAQILNLLLELQRERSLTYVVISHNVAVIRHFCDTVAVMYLGQFVECGPAAVVLSNPRHPYTRLLLDSVAEVGRGAAAERIVDASELPSNRHLPSGCFFRDRCPDAAPGCERPQHLVAPRGDAVRQVRCHVAAAGP
ncbi:MAG: ATP-binding cassette domain-containing protein [Azospirillaceae bacterium]|nr:ATP-binding cassette domain-containing protein [Azospirillaceae bacterium]